MKMRKAILLGALLAAVLPSAAYGAQWVEGTDGTWSYEQDDGTWLTNGFSPDGYYVDGSGKWYDSLTILETSVPSRNSFRSSQEEVIFAGCEDIFNQVQETLYRDLGNVRRFRLSNQRLGYGRTDGDQYTELFSLEQNREKGEFTLTVRCPLTRKYQGNIPMSWYDFQCLRVVTNLLSRTGDQLAEAVYYSWEGDNRYGVKLEQWTQVGDAWISYRAAEGAGIYSIRAAF